MKDIKELEKLTFDQLKSMYVVLKLFNAYPKNVRKAILNQINQKMEKKRIKESINYG